MLGVPAFALDPRYPDWPCDWKVPEISIASVWAGPPIEAADKGPLDPKQAELVRVWPRAEPPWRTRGS